MTKIRRNQKKVSLIRKLIAGVSGTVLALLIWEKSDLFFYAKKLECYTQYGNCPAIVVSNLAWTANYPLLKPLPTSRIKESLKQFTDIKKFSLFRRLPHTLVLSIEMRKPVGTIGPQVLGAKIITDEEGVAIGKTDQNRLPLLIDNSNIKIGDKLQPFQLDSIKVLGQMNTLSEGVLVGKNEDGTLTVFFPENFTVLMDLSHKASNWYTTLQVILTRSKILSKIPKVIDLRYSSPIVTF